jgi:hypothetical protein
MATGVLLQILAIVVGSGMVQLLIFLLKRRGELSALDRTSSKPLLEGQGAFIDRLAAAEIKALARVSVLEARIEAMTLDFAEKMQISNAERHRMAVQLAELRSDLDVARAQIEGLRAELRRQSTR